MKRGKGSYVGGILGGGYGRIDGMESGKGSYSGGILGEEGVGGKWNGKERKELSWRFLVKEVRGGLMEGGGEEGTMLEVF